MICFDSMYVKYLLCQIHRQDVEWWQPGTEGGGTWGLLVNAYKTSAWNGEKVLTLDHGGCCTTIRIYLISLNCTLQSTKMTFYFTYISYAKNFFENISLPKTLKSVFGLIPPLLHLSRNSSCFFSEMPVVCFSVFITFSLHHLLPRPTWPC